MWFMDIGIRVYVGCVYIYIYICVNIFDNGKQ